MLHAERLEDRPRVLPRDVLEVEGEAVDEPPVPEREQLHRGDVTVDGEPYHVDGAHRPLVRRLPLREALDRVEPVPVTGRLLERSSAGRSAHRSLERAADRPVSPERNSITPSMISP